LLWAGCLLVSFAGAEDPLASAADAQPAASVVQKAAGGRVEIVAALVASDLSVRPLPKFRFLIRTEGAAEGAPPAGEVVTGFDGRGGLDLPPGKYRLVSESPISWEGSALSWDLLLEITAGATAHVEISNDNARKGAATSGQVTEEARIFQRSRQAVFLVETSSGQGSGFLADPAGLILTNFHVVGDSRYVAVKVDATRKYPAQVLSTD
jgi:S1-C subfamily serine protease